MAEGLGILEMDGGRYVAPCSGEAPSRILEYVVKNDGVSGGNLLSVFAGPPCGYPPDVAKACIAGLLRGGKIQIRAEAGPRITSVRDPGVKDMFTRDRDIKRADILPTGEADITSRDRASICQFFENTLHVPLDRENDAIADSVFHRSPPRRRSSGSLWTWRARDRDLLHGCTPLFATGSRGVRVDVQAIQEFGHSFTGSAVPALGTPDSGHLSITR